MLQVKRKSNSENCLSLKFYVLLISYLLQTAKVVGFSGKHFAEKLFWLEHEKQINFPKGIMFRMTSSAEVPLWKTLSESVTSSMSIEVPITLQLDKLLLGDINRRKVSFPYHPRTTDENDRKKRAVGFTVMNKEDSCTAGQRQRINVLKKLESILNTMGIAGGPCLLRTICEFHEYDLFKNYGLLGEITKLVFSMRDEERKCPNEFSKAEDKGKMYRCSDYYKLCSKSLFGWKTNYLPYFLSII